MVATNPTRFPTHVARLLAKLQLRDRIQAPADASREQLEQLARDRPKIQAHIDGNDVIKVVVVPQKLVNFVVR